LDCVFAVESQPGDIVVARWMKQTWPVLKVDPSQTRALVEAKQGHFRRSGVRNLVAPDAERGLLSVLVPANPEWRKFARVDPGGAA
jgi:hypothetical protein